MENSVLIEACVDSLTAAEAALDAGADRLELCDFRVPDGMSPSFTLVEAVLRVSHVPVHVLVRPRGGSFVFGPNEVAVMVRQIFDLKGLGVQGMVIGALTPNGGVDQSITTTLQRMALPHAVTFHRALDATPDPGAALEVLINLRVGRVLTSGHAPSAEAGIPVLKELVRRAAGRLGIIAAGGIRAHNALHIVQETGVREIHSRGEIAGLVRAVRAG